MHFRSFSYAVFYLPVSRLKTLHQFLALLLISRFSEKREHIFLITLHTRLVKWVHSQYISADSAGKLEEIEQLAETEFVLFRNTDHEIRNISIGVSQLRSLHRVLIHKIKRLSSEIIQSVQILSLIHI